MKTIIRQSDERSLTDEQIKDMIIKMTDQIIEQRQLEKQRLLDRILFVTKGKPIILQNKG